MNAIRIFIGTDERGGRGEAVIAYGTRRYASKEVSIVPMRPGGMWNGVRHREEGEWDRGREHAVPYSGQGWATNFSCFRFAVPELCDFDGRAVYLDADITVHGDIADLVGMPLERYPVAIRYAVMVFECGHPFWRSQEWPRLNEMKRSGRGFDFYSKLLHSGVGAARVPLEWEVFDGSEMDPTLAKLNHYTNMSVQPYHPFPDRFAYPVRHPCAACDVVWWQSYHDTLAERLGLTASRRTRRLAEILERRSRWRARSGWMPSAENVATSITSPTIRACEPAHL